MIKEKTNNIADYLAWRGDVPLSVAPFNEVDNLLLCALTYAKLCDIIPEDGFLSMGDIRDCYFKTHSREELSKRNFFTSKAPLMLDEVADGARFGGTAAGNMVAVVDDDADAQMAAMTYLLDDGTAYVCFCGTDDSVSGWKENFIFSYLTETMGQRLAVRYLNEAAAKIDRPLRVGGHSKGGNFAVYAAAFADESVQNRITEVYSNDGPGFRPELIEREGYRRILPKVISIIPETSIIGQLLEHEYPDIVVRSSGSGIQQHDSFTWCVNRKGFIHGELSDAGRFFGHALADWLSKMDDASRAEFVDALFAPLEESGSSTFGEMNRKWREATEKIIESISNMSDEKQNNLRSALHSMFRSGGDTILYMIKEDVDEIRKFDREHDEKKREALAEGSKHDQSDREHDEEKQEPSAEEGEHDK